MTQIVGWTDENNGRVKGRNCKAETDALIDECIRCSVLCLDAM